jgi:NAD(P)-dependent dehydrogenase (short-subunit alcohol dehydrogenase family)
VDYRPLQIDLSSQDSVRAAAARLNSWTDVPTVDILINTAGVMGMQERTLTKEGVEMHLATNHLGHWLFTCLIAPKLIKAAESSPKGATRIVNVSSGSPTISTMRWSDMAFDVKNKDLPEAEQPNYEFLSMWGYEDPQVRAYIPFDGYNRSKVANILFGIGANKRLFEKHGILSVGVHPGVIRTELSRNLSDDMLEQIQTLVQGGRVTYKTLGAGSSTSLVAALDPKLAERVGETKDGSENWGAFMQDCQPNGGAQVLAVSSSEAEKLWEWSEKATGESFSW